METKQQLPSSNITLILGILSMLFGFGMVGLILGIIALSISAEPKKMYLANPDMYYGYSNLKAGRTCAIIGICLSAVVIIIVIVVVVLMIMGGGSAVKTSDYTLFK